jgi:hypothetical protein
MRSIQQGNRWMSRTKLKDIRSNTPVLPGDLRLNDRVEKPPSAFICEAITLPGYAELPYIFDLEQGELLEFTLCSDIPVDVLLCNADDYFQWVDSGYDPEVALLVHLEAEDVLAHILRFTAPTSGEYAVLLMNWNECPADLAIEIPDWLTSALR